MKNRRLIALVLTLALCLGVTGCGGKETEDSAFPAYADESGASVPVEEAGELVILYTNDVHNAYRRDDTLGQLGYAALAAYRDTLAAEGNTVTLIDGGDALQGEAVGELSKGADPVDIMNEVGYTLAVPGNHEFDFGVDAFLSLAENRASFAYIACNFIDLRTGETVFDAYKIMDYNGVKIGYVGICTPETADTLKGSGNYGFIGGEDGQELYDCVQQAIDSAKADGADYVICVGHLGTDPKSTPWTSYEVISNVTGMIAFLDAHSHSVIEGQTVSDKDGNDVLLCSTGAKLTAIGEVRVNLNTGEAESSLVTGISEDNKEILTLTDSIAERIEKQLAEATAAVETTAQTENG